MNLVAHLSLIISSVLALNSDVNHSALTGDKESGVSNILSSLKSRTKQLAQAVPGSATVGCIASSNPTSCQNQARLEHDLRGLMLKGPTNLAAMQAVKQKLAVPSAYGLDAAQANDIFHKLIKEMNFDQKAYELVTNAAKNTSATAAAIAPILAPTAAPLTTAAIAQIVPGSAATMATPTLNPMIASVSALTTTAGPTTQMAGLTTMKAM